MLLIWALSASLLTIVAMLLAAGLVLAAPWRARPLVVSALLSYAVGSLLGAAFLGLLPHAVDRAGVSRVFAVTLAGMVLFFALEKLVLWRHCHDGRCEIHGAAGPLILMGDALHNFVDGVVIAGAFLTAIPLGFATTLAVLAHEIPQELGDFAILLDRGYTPNRALAFNTLSSLTTPLGALLGYFILETVQRSLPDVLALSAASFLYIATADLIPDLHKRVTLTSSLSQLFLLLLGVGTILLIESFH